MKTRKFFKVYGAVDPVRERARRRPVVSVRDRRITHLTKEQLDTLFSQPKFDLEKPGQYSDYWKAGAKAAKEKAPGT